MGSASLQCMLACCVHHPNPKLPAPTQLLNPTPSLSTSSSPSNQVFVDEECWGPRRPTNDLGQLGVGELYTTSQYAAVATQMVFVLFSFAFPLGMLLSGLLIL